MSEKEYIAYKGQEFQIEWYYAPKGEKDRALKCMESYKTRVKEGTYYEKEK